MTEKTHLYYRAKELSEYKQFSFLFVFQIQTSKKIASEESNVIVNQDSKSSTAEEPTLYPQGALKNIHQKY